MFSQFVIDNECYPEFLCCHLGWSCGSTFRRYENENENEQDFSRKWGCEKMECQARLMEFLETPEGSKCEIEH